MTGKSSTPGKFITLEGGEGAGKSTQARLLAAHLQSTGIKALVTREPGGSPYGEKIRDLILAERPVAPETEFLLFAAARCEHLAAVIRPALLRGEWIVCDRFIDSTRVYQGRLLGIEPRLIAAIEECTVAPSYPDLTLILDVPAEIGAERARQRGDANRYDSERLETHQLLRAGFLDIARLEPLRCAVIEGAAPVEEVDRAIWSAVSARLLEANR